MWYWFYYLHMSRYSVVSYMWNLLYHTHKLADHNHGESGNMTIYMMVIMSVIFYAVSQLKQ